jgi:hypothetical protein
MNNNIYFFLDSLRFIFTFTADKLVVTNFINMTKTAKKEAEKTLENWVYFTFPGTLLKEIF